jgi:hypothetical protein
MRLDRLAFGSTAGIRLMRVRAPAIPPRPCWSRDRPAPPCPAACSDDASRSRPATAGAESVIPAATDKSRRRRLAPADRDSREQQSRRSLGKVDPAPPLQFPGPAIEQRSRTAPAPGANGPTVLAQLEPRAAVVRPLPRQAAGRASARDRPPAAPPSPHRPAGRSCPFLGTSRARIIRRWRTAAPPAARIGVVARSSAAPGSSIDVADRTSRGSKSPPSLIRARTHRVIARLARLLGSSTSPRASPSGSPPACCRISPAASASANARCAGMV